MLKHLSEAHQLWYHVHDLPREATGSKLQTMALTACNSSSGVSRQLAEQWWRFSKNLAASSKQSFPDLHNSIQSICRIAGKGAGCRRSSQTRVAPSLEKGSAVERSKLQISWRPQHKDVAKWPKCRGEMEAASVSVNLNVSTLCHHMHTLPYATMASSQQCALRARAVVAAEYPVPSPQHFALGVERADRAQSRSPTGTTGQPGALDSSFKHPWTRHIVNSASCGVRPSQLNELAARTTSRSRMIVVRR